MVLVICLLFATPALAGCQDKIEIKKKSTQAENKVFKVFCVVNFDIKNNTDQDASVLVHFKLGGENYPLVSHSRAGEATVSSVSNAGRGCPFGGGNHGYRGGNLQYRKHDAERMQGPRRGFTLETMTLKT